MIAVTMRVRLPISVVILTYNEERNIAACLASVASWAGEIFVVDSGSTDGTRNIVARYTEHCVEHPFENYASQRNWAQQNLLFSYTWVLHIDADERVTSALARSFQAFFDSNRYRDVNGAMFSRRTVFMGRWIRHGGHYPVYHVRLFRRDKGRCEDRLYDQHFVVRGTVIQLSGDLIDTLTPSLEPWMLRHIHWAAAEAQESIRTSGHGETQVVAKLGGSAIQRRRWLRERMFGRMPLFLRAFAYFFYRYVLRLGFLDGTEGLIFHFLQGCWFRFYTDAKIWEANHTSGAQGYAESSDGSGDGVQSILEPQ